MLYYKGSQKGKQNTYHWLSKIPKRYKRNIITRDLHRAENIASNMKEEMQTIRKKFIKADYPKPFVNSVINQYNN